VRPKPKAIEEEAGAGVLTTVRRLQIVTEEQETQKGWLGETCCSGDVIHINMCAPEK